MVQEDMNGEVVLEGIGGVLMWCEYAAVSRPAKNNHADFLCESNDAWTYFAVAC